MTTYLELQELLKVHDDKFREWEHALREAAVSLRDELVKSLKLPTEDFKQLMSMTASSREIIDKKRVELNIEDVNHDHLLFSITINFENYKSFCFYLSVYLNDFESLYKSAEPEPSEPFLSKKDMSGKIIEILTSSLGFDPFSDSFSGKDQYAMGFRVYGE